MPLATQTVTAPDAAPDRTIVFLHGILGSGANWRTFAKQIVAAKPRWRAVLVDLRLHGDSTDLPPPHTVDSAANDIVDAMAAFTPNGKVDAILGHSFGGKVALALADKLGGDLDRLFVVDANPGARPDARGSESTRHIVELLTELPEEFADRKDFTKWAEERGVSRPVAMWLAMNVRPVTGTTRFVFRIDIQAVRTMVEDYFALDLWRVLESPPGRMQTTLIAGGKSTVVDAPDLERARKSPRCEVLVIPDAGHWVHVDAPDALREMVVERLEV
jgi:esterase